MTEPVWKGACESDACAEVSCETNMCAEVAHDENSGEILLRSNRYPDVHVSFTRQEWTELVNNPFFKTV